MDISNFIIDNMNNPRELERMFRKEPEIFKRSFLHVWEQNSNSQILSVWYERLNYKETEKTEGASLIDKSFVFMGILAILSGITTRILLYFVEQQGIAPINLIFGILPFMAAYFLYNNSAKKNIVYTIAALFLMSGVYLNLIPFEQKDSMILAYLHLPVFLWVLLGLAFTGNEYSMGSARLNYLKFNGEFCILYASMAISGMLLTALTMQLFGVIGMHIEEFYFENIVLFGVASLAIVASYLVSRNLKFTKTLVPYIAKIFSPLMLTTLIAYLIVAIWVGKNPFLDRDFLILFNEILIIVLAVTIFSITENDAKGKKSISDYINFTLIFLSLMIDSVAFLAMVFRLSFYGITANRLATVGINILIWGNLFWIMLSYIKFLKSKSGYSAIQDAVTKYLPIYGIWAAFVTFTFPLIFK
ncbi:DUF4153 domain-containing protein [Defluviitalea raffinosedens]|uniref:DUF4153 domain-containing protein n=1 Tax=Defluviitalea raffinosedens TaxID=1450156 RepID=A0A7C8LC22_9FIRM|nr:DUF4153 domain-containing protein [Defluviitalea raffinosedens]KAE9629129.1 DUF4153 domain-containing protein [Defluviitalea raffinosedens]